MAVYNVVEMLARSCIEDEYFRKQTLSCNCGQCTDDVLALALNRLPCRYVSSDIGNAYVKAEYFSPQFQSDIIRELALAASIVARQPRHKGAGTSAG